MDCVAPSSRAYEPEVTKHGGFDAEKIKNYKAVCHEFLCHNDEFEQ